jgi:hypothetical protein
LDASSTSPPRACSSCWAWLRRTDDAERLDPQARQHLDLVHRGRTRPKHRPAPPGLQGRLSDQEGSPRRPAGGAGSPAVGDVRGAVQADGWQLPAGGVAPENQPPRLRPSSFANYTIYTKTHVVPRLGEVELQRLTPSTLSGFYRALLTDARRDGQGLAPKTRAQHPRDAAPGPFETPSVSATWSATWPTRRLSAVPRCPSRSILGLSNWAFASPPRVPIPRCSCQLSWMVP